MKESKNEIHVLAHRRMGVEQGHPNPRKLLGYIRFKKIPGSVELTNFQAHVTRHNLKLGGTTKRNARNVAGMHGEGLKIAALVLLREEHRVRITSKNLQLGLGISRKGQIESILQINAYLRDTSAECTESLR